MSQGRDIYCHFAAIRDGGTDGALEKAADEVIAACNGNMRAAVETLVVALSFAEERIEKLNKAVSHAFARELFYRNLERSEHPADN